MVRDPTDGAPSSSDPDLSALPATADSLEQLIGAAVRAPAEPPGLAPGDELAGRYRIERLVGAGGMGAVYLARDAKLERQVAIKLHHATHGMDRLHREAVAMARLAHPNVITVFEVGAVGDQAFVAMEYVAGPTLRGWLGSAPRTVRERLAALIGAGTGLAAAHDAGLVHRDFKPDNVLIGDDGRARVGDFGLARGSQSHGDPVSADAAATERDSLDTPITRTGAVLGTPAYMAPEQALGGKVDARADQFAFCVVCWEVLFGERPFAGALLPELLVAISAGPRRPQRGSKIRPAIRHVLARGLAVDPDARFGDMHELLAALRRASRSRVPLAIGGVVAVGAIAAVLIAQRHAGAPSCDEAGAEVATALPRGLPARVRALGGAFAVEGADRIASSIDGFSTAYRAVAQTACRAEKIDHAWSPELYRQSTACMALRLRTAAVLLAPDAQGDDPAMLVNQAVQLPMLAGCVDPATLAAAPPLPADPALLEATVAARARLDAAQVQSSLGRIDAARAALAEVETSPAAGEPGVAARMALVRSFVLRSEDQITASEAALSKAYFAGRAVDDVEVVLVAVAALIDSTGEVREDRASAANWIGNGIADANRARTRSPSLASSVYASAASVQLLEDQVAESAANARLAVQLVDHTRSLALVNALMASAGASCAAGKYDACFADEARALELTRTLLGANHPRIGAMLATMALDHNTDEHKAEALALAEQAKAILDASAESSDIDVAHTETALAAMLYDGDDQTKLAGATAMLVDARKRLVRRLGANHPDVAQVDMNLALYESAVGERQAALARLRSALAIQEHALGPTATRVGDTLYNLAVTLRDLQQYPEALTVAERCVDILGDTRPGTENHAVALILVAELANLTRDHARAYALAIQALGLPVLHEPVFGHAWAAMEAGHALLAQHRDLAHARALLLDARATYAGIKAETHVAECRNLSTSLRHRYALVE